ncbi:MAG: succinate dehydrogenase iron-sulfur subunit [Blastocatellia bacterium]|nr:succinate dehydrogenase iron-sulfur subunit [Blastocatellia bacterium]
MAEKSLTIKVKRQEDPSSKSYWEEFEIPYRPNMNIIICLMEIRKRPITKDGKQTTPVVWESSCLEHVCGACSMVINDQARQACSTLVDKIDHPIVIEPMTKFPLIRDLKVDRSRLFSDLKKAKAWVPVDGTHNLGPGPRLDAETQELRYKLSTCMSCGVCMEVCPQYNPKTLFVGPSVINQVRLMNMHPTGAMHKKERLEAMMEEGGVQDCGNAQNCVRACPKHIPLTESIADVNRQTTWEGLFGWLK